MKIQKKKKKTFAIQYRTKKVLDRIYINNRKNQDQQEEGKNIENTVEKIQ